MRMVYPEPGGVSWSGGWFTLNQGEPTVMMMVYPEPGGVSWSGGWFTLNQVESAGHEDGLA
jgi:hypothetical protein